ncbi:hypothetical protein DL93DRAFT_14933 [Clavulina sp. PMI_390]|nr:hypothetical protein DL93DRAFT_14933 [Clavulina sp. PMI_390]
MPILPFISLYYNYSTGQLFLTTDGRNPGQLLFPLTLRLPTRDPQCTPCSPRACRHDMSLPSAGKEITDHMSLLPHPSYTQYMAEKSRASPKRSPAWPPSIHIQKHGVSIWPFICQAQQSQTSTRNHLHSLGVRGLLIGNPLMNPPGVWRLDC